MKALSSKNVLIGLAATSFALCGALAIGSCAGDGGTSTGTKTSTPTSTPTSTVTSTPTSTVTSTPTSTPTGTDTSITIIPPSGKAVIFSAGQATGAMTGWGWIAMGQLDSATSPTCSGTAITKATPCASGTSWASASSLCLSGSIPALPAAPVQTDYDNNWGLQIGVNATNAEPTGTLGSNAANFTSVTFNVTGTPSAGLRAMFHVSGDPDTKSYCANMVSGTAMMITSFNTACWDGSGTALTAAQIPNIDKAGVQVSSTATAITVTSLCLTGITFGP